MKIPYVYKKESDIDKFTSNGSIIEQKKYMNDLTIYSPMNQLRADYALSDIIPEYTVEPEKYTGGPFGAYLKISDDYSFKLANFDSLSDNARISFYAGANVISEKPSVSLVKNSNFPEDGLSAGDYTFKVNVEGEPEHTVRITLAEGSKIKAIKNKLLFEIDEKYPFSLNVSNTDSNSIVIQSNITGKAITITNVSTTGTADYNLLDYFDVQSCDYGSAPETSIDIFKLFNLTITHFNNTESGNSKSYLRFTLSGDTDQTIEVPWNNDAIHLDNIEVNFDDNLIYIFINGTLTKIELLTNHFTNNGTTLTLSGTENNPYSFDELIINKRCIHTKDFALAATQLTPYSVEKPFIDYYFAGSEIKEGMEYNTNSCNGIECTICDNGNYYYWNAGSWRSCDGSYSYTNDIYTFQNKITDFPFSGNDFFVRTFFVSDGLKCAYIDTPYFSMEDDLYEDENGNTAAILIGTKEWAEDETQDLDGKTLTITTDQGSLDITFNKDSDFDPETAEEDKVYTLDKVVEIINSYYPEGIANCAKDSLDRCTLTSETKGSDAYITVSGEAAPFIFSEDGTSAVPTATGTNADSGTIDYTDFYEAVRNYTGEPLISMEITDEQMRLYLKEAMAYYKRYKADALNQYTCTLSGNWKEGYDIPSVIENQRDIVDIIFRPIFPITFYGSDFIDEGSDNIFTLTIAQSIFGGTRGGTKQASGIVQDYYISLMSMQDFRQTLGLNPTWEVFNNKLYIYPSNVSRFTNVSIVYKAPLSEEECLKDPDFIKYVHGKCLMTMGNIRGQYGASLTSGSVALTFNADNMYTRGKEMVDAVLEYWKTSQKPLGFFFG